MNVKKTKKFKENRPENYHVHDTQQSIVTELVAIVEEDILDQGEESGHIMAHCV